jgi:hypothetical protein
MAKKTLNIVTNEAVRRTMAALGSPVVQVAVRGRVEQCGNGNGCTLVIENISTCRSETLPIIASQPAIKALAAAASCDTCHDITLAGRVIQNANGNCLFLERAANTEQMPIVADACVRQKLTNMAKQRGGEVTVKAKVVQQGCNRVLVLAGHDGGKSK